VSLVAVFSGFDARVLMERAVELRGGVGMGRTPACALTS
jgi:hypothetical protein